MRQATHFVPANVDQGGADDFLVEQLKPEVSAAKVSGYPLELAIHEGYDHSYYFISSFIEEHLLFHVAYLNKSHLLRLTIDLAAVILGWALCCGVIRHSKYRWLAIRPH